MEYTLIILLSLGVLVLAVLRGAQSLRHSRDTERGCLPGKGDHVIHSDYSSGGGGGGHATTYTVPRDPQEYAKRFVPRGQPRATQATHASQATQAVHGKPGHAPQKGQDR